MMNEILNTLTLVPQAGLSDLWDSFRDDWLGPLFLAAVGVFAIVFIKDRAWMKLIGFVGIAAIVGLLIYGSESLFGSEDATLTGVAKGAADDINVIAPASVGGMSVDLDNGVVNLR